MYIILSPSGNTNLDIYIRPLFELFYQSINFLQNSPLDVKGGESLRETLEQIPEVSIPQKQQLQTLEDNEPLPNSTLIMAVAAIIVGLGYISYKILSSQ